MNWDEVGAIGQVLGSLAVFITLGYLAIQVRHARKEMQRSLSQSRSDGVRELAMNRANNRQWSSSDAKVSMGLAVPLNPFMTTVMERCGLTVEEASGLFWDQLAWWVHRVHGISYIDEETAGVRLELDEVLRFEYGSGTIPVARLWYETMKSHMNAGAVRYIDNLLAQPG